VKLLLCLRCQDVRKLRMTLTTCDCGDSFGRYLEDGHSAEYGGPSRVLGLGNGSLLRALQFGPGSEKPDAASSVAAWVKPVECPRLSRVDVCAVLGSGGEGC
jgi:hypothetical protein